LLDVSESTNVFARDQEFLLAQIRRVLGGGLVTAFRFRSSPARGVLSESTFEPLPYRPPRPGWPVVLLTDLGIGAGLAAAPSKEWRGFADCVRGAGCHLIALVPYPPLRWPAEISSVMDVVQWDRATTVRTIRATVGRSAGGYR
jgi:hypothetical protein